MISFTSVLFFFFLNRLFSLSVLARAACISSTLDSFWKQQDFQGLCDRGRLAWHGWSLTCMIITRLCLPAPCLNVWVCTHQCTCPHKTEALHLLQVELQGLVNRSTWVLGTELRSCARTARALTPTFPAGCSITLERVFLIEPGARLMTTRLRNVRLSIYHSPSFSHGGLEIWTQILTLAQASAQTCDTISLSPLIVCLFVFVLPHFMLLKYNFTRNPNTWNRQTRHTQPRSLCRVYKTQLQTLMHHLEADSNTSTLYKS